MDTDTKLPDLYVEAADKPEYVGIPIKTMKTDAILDTQLYLKLGQNKYVKFRGTRVELDKRIRQRLLENRHTHLYIKGDNVKSLNRYLELNLNNVLHDSSISRDEKAAVLNEITKYIVKELFVDPSSKTQVRDSRHFVESTADFILSNRAVLGHLMALSAFDYATHTHSAEVMAYAISLGKKMGIKEGMDLIELGQAALLHDVGKAYIKPSITKKSGPLSQEEFTEMKKHPIFGYLVLHSTGVPSQQVLHVVRHHHEDLKGSGYPHRLNPRELGLDVRIVTCCDIFNALTTKRTFRKAYRTFPALKLMKELVGFKVDDNVFRAFVRMLGNVG